MTPLGERARGQDWKTTVTVYVTGAVVAGAGVGAALGWLGTGLGGVLGFQQPGVGLLFLGAALALAVALEAAGRLPTIQRQVDDAWMDRYRGWFYGLLFGAQLGGAFFTIVNTGAVYATFLAALLSGSPSTGAVVGATFGAARTGVQLLSRQITTAGQLAALHRRLLRCSGRSRRLALGAQTALACAILAGAALSSNA